MKDIEIIEVKDYREKTGKGITGIVNDSHIVLGSEDFVTGSKVVEKGNFLSGSSKVFVSIDDKYLGYFSISNSYRQGLAELVQNLETNYDLHLLSGDNETERSYLKNFFKDPLQMHFHQTPENKLKYIRALQNEGHEVLMMGDGLNDAGALKQSNVGISISEDVSNFSPACDGILNASEFSKISDIIKFSKTA